MHCGFRVDRQTLCWEFCIHVEVGQDRYHEVYVNWVCNVLATPIAQESKRKSEVLDVEWLLEDLIKYRMRRLPEDCLVVLKWRQIHGHG